MQKITIRLPRVSVATSLADTIMKEHHDAFTEGNVVLIINGQHCVLITKFFVDYFTSLIKKYPGIVEVIRQGGPAILNDIGEFHTEISGTDFTVMVDTLKDNIVTNIDSIGSYVSVTYEVKDIEILAIALLKRGFKIDKA